MCALKRIIHQLVLLVLPVVVIGQGAPLVWGEIAMSDRLMKVYEKDTSAIAVVLADGGELIIQEKYILKQHKRVKLLKKPALDQYGQVNLYFYHKDNDENIINLKAQTILPDGTKYEVKSKDFFSVKENDRWSTISFAFPNLEVGAIIEWTYELISTHVIEPRTWYFQEQIPVRYSNFRISNESRISYVSLFQGGESFPKIGTQKDKTIYGNGETRLIYGDKEITMEHAPALEEEDFITTMDDYGAKVRFQAEYYFRRDGSRENLFTTWDAAAQNLLELPSFGEQFLRKKNFKKILEAVEPLIKEGMSKAEIMQVIYSFLVSNVTYNGTNRFTTSESIEKAFLEKNASSGELNMMCLALLKAFEIDAFPILTSTRDHGKINKEYPLIDQFNYLLVGVELNGETILLDATDPLRPIKMPNPQVLNKPGWIVDPKRMAWVDIIVPMCRDIYGSELTIDEAGNIVGKLRAISNSYTALSEMHKYRSDRTGSYWKERIEGFVQEVVIDSVSFQGTAGINDKIVNEVYFKLPNGALQSGDFIYVSPVFYSNFQDNPFKLNKRAYPIDFSYPFEERYVSSIILPDGYTLEELPKEVTYTLPESIGTFQYKVSQTGNKIQMMLLLSINKTSIPPIHYEAFKGMFDLMIAKRGEQIVLKKNLK
ncbi:MAG: DUF3857 domain-containing protein [Saprospiraceae bacterium]